MCKDICKERSLHFKFCTIKFVILIINMYICVPKMEFKYSRKTKYFK